MKNKDELNEKKNKENKKLNEIILDQEKVINELKDIIHKNNDKIIKLKSEQEKINILNKSKIDLMNKELQDLSQNYINKVQAYNEVQKN